MAKWQFKGVDELIAKYQDIVNQSPDTVKKAVGAGAAVVADAIKSEIQGLPVTNQYNSGSITSVQKKGLIEGFGIAKARDDDGFINVKLGFDGYNGQKTKKYPNGQPNSMIARSINSGSSFRQKDPFVDRATKASKAECEKAIQDKFDDEIQKMI